MKTKSAQPQYKEYNDAMIAVLAQFKDKLSSMEMLAIASNFVGRLIALQDQRNVTKEMAMDIVGKNIEAGNAEMINSLLRSEGGNA